jgi:hypothetical protein
VFSSGHWDIGQVCFNESPGVDPSVYYDVTQPLAKKIKMSTGLALDDARAITMVCEIGKERPGFSFDVTFPGKTIRFPKAPEAAVAYPSAEAAVAYGEIHTKTRVVPVVLQQSELGVVWDDKLAEIQRPEINRRIAHKDREFRDRMRAWVLDQHTKGFSEKTEADYQECTLDGTPIPRFNRNVQA